MPWEKGVSKIIFGKKIGTVEPVLRQAKHWVSSELPRTGLEELQPGPPVEDPRDLLVGALYEKVLPAVSDKQFHEKREDLLHLPNDRSHHWGALQSDSCL